MNNTHQELMAEKVNKYTEADSLFRLGEGELERWARLQNLLVEILQDTIDTVAAEERRRVLPYIERIRLDVDVIICKCGEKYKDSDLDLSVQELEEALDTTPPNKV